MLTSFWADGLTDSLALATTATPDLDAILLPSCLRRQLHTPSRQSLPEEKDDEAVAAAAVLPGSQGAVSASCRGAEPELSLISLRGGSNAMMAGISCRTPRF